jgi:hypothetical protein
VATGHEIERKFLVSAIPDDRGAGVHILQGYLPLASEDNCRDVLDMGGSAG